MAVYEAEQHKNHRPMPTPSAAGEVKAARAVYTVAAGELALNNVFKMLRLPPNCVPVDVILDVTDLDTGGTPAVTLSVGQLNAAGTDLESGKDFITDSTVAQGGGIARMDQAAGKWDKSDSERTVAVKVTTAPAQAAAGTIGLELLYRDESFGK